MKETFLYHTIITYPPLDIHITNHGPLFSNYSPQLHRGKKYRSWSQYREEVKEEGVKIILGKLWTLCPSIFFVVPRAANTSIFK